MNEVKQIGNLTENPKRDNPQTYRVYDKEGISPTLNCMQGGNLQPMIIEDFYKNREPRVYDKTSPTIRAEREGLKVIEEQPVIIGGMQKNQSVKTDGVCTTLTSSRGTGGGYVPMVVEDYLMPGNNFNQCNKVHPENGICRTIIGQGHAGNEPKVIVASRGRNPENPSDRTPGNHVEQRLEPNSEGICNTLTSVQKDNLVLEPAILTPKRTEYGKAIRKDYENGKIQESRHNMTELQPRSDGISNTLTTVQKDNLVLEPKKTYLENAIEQIVEKNNGEIPDAWDLYNKNPINNGISKTLGADCGHTGTAGATAVTHNYRIRKLTPKECAKLMKFSDEDANKMLEVNSNTQVYKQCGNSIVVSVLEAIFCQMNIKGCPTWEERAKEEYL